MRVDYTLVIQSRLKYDMEFMKRCLLALYAQQEAYEQAVRATSMDNGIGFNKSDALLLTSAAQQLIGDPKATFPLGSVMAISQRLHKYTRQLSHLLTIEEIET